jgi:hypothetical protein
MLNENQKKATYVALAAFALTIFFAPWQLSIMNHGTRHNLGTRHAPVWEAPAVKEFQYPPETRLMVESLIIEWVTTAVFYIAALKLLQNSRKDALDREIRGLTADNGCKQEGHK